MVPLAQLFSTLSSPAALGLGLVALASSSRLGTSLVDEGTKLDQDLGAVARMRVFCEETPTEEDEVTDEAVPGSWPDSGEIVFEGAATVFRSVA